MDTRIIMILISFGAMLLILLSIPVRRKITSKKFGKLLLKIKDKNIISSIGAYVLAFALVGILFIRDFGMTMNLVLCGCGILAVELMTRDVCLYKKYGVYENGVIGDGNRILYKSILGFPALRLSPQERKERYNEKSLVIVTEERGEKVLFFESEGECVEVVETIFEAAPELKKYL